MPIASAKTQINIPEGVHEAVLTSCVDIGTQHSERFGNSTHKVILTWEIPSCLNSDGEPVTISKFYTLSISPKAALRRDIEALLGRALKEKHFELKDLLGTPALIQLTKSESNGKERTNISAVMKLPAKKRIEPFRDLISFDITDPEIPDGVPEWIRTYIEMAEERQGERKIDGENGKGESQDEPHEETMPDLEIVPEEKTDLKPF